MAGFRTVFFILFTILNVINNLMLRDAGVSDSVYWTSTLCICGTYMCGFFYAALRKER